MNRLILIIPFLIIPLVISVDNAFAQINSNNAFILEGSGFGVNEKMINNSEIDFIFSTGTSTGTTISSTVKDGFFSLNGVEYILDFHGNSFRDGKFLQFSGTATQTSGLSSTKTTISLFGRLIQESSEGSIYGFTGKLTQGQTSQKLIYNAKISKLADTIVTSPTKTTEPKIPEIHILKGSSDPSSITYKQLTQTQQQLSYITPDRVTVKPGSEITFVNDDTKPHKIFSGTENYNDRHKPFTEDGRIKTEIIQPGKSLTIKIEEKGFYRLFDPDYTWINMIVYSFPDVDSLKIRDVGKGTN